MCVCFVGCAGSSLLCRLFSSCRAEATLLLQCSLLVVLASLVAEHRPEDVWTQELQHMDLAAL